MPKSTSKASSLRRSLEGWAKKSKILMNDEVEEEELSQEKYEEEFMNQDECENEKTDVKEVWFSGCHAGKVADFI